MTNIGPSLLVTISGLNIRQILKVSNTVKPNLLKRYGIKNITEATITVFIRFSREEESDARIIHQNLDPNVPVITTSESDVKTTVLVKGSEDALKSLDESKIVATIDLSNYTSEGEYEVDVKASGEDVKLSYEPKTTKVKVIIRKK